MTDSPFHVIFLGASTRAAATSARRAGWTPWCADLFADADSKRIATVRKIAAAAYPQGLLATLAEAPPGPVIYTGALENRPALLARLDRPLWGNPPAVLRAIRSPSRWTQCLQARGLPCPEIREAPANGDWLLKPRKSAGGFGMQKYTGQPFDPRTHFLQEWIDGQPCSAIFLGRDDGAQLLGVTQQLIGTSWLHATGFHYAGNIGPLTLDARQRESWRRIGAELARTFHLRGLFGVDAIVRDGFPWPIEINPRYTASVEILERSGKAPLLLGHRDAFESSVFFDCDALVSRTRKRRSSFNPSLARPANEPVHGKAILYARETLSFPQRGPWLTSLEADVDLDAVEHADIPHAGDLLEQGRPVLTLFASAPTVAECLAKLQEKALALDRCLWG